MKLPQIIQGGMGLGISNWQLARSVSMRGQLGVVSGTSIDLILSRRLQDGDEGGDMRRAIAAFPDQEMGQRVLDRYFIEGGRAEDKPYKSKPMVGEKPSRHLVELLIVANFVEVYLAKEGHDGVVGINYLHKIQAPMIPSLYGAMLAGVNAVLIGAGIPVEIPKILDALCANEEAEFTLHVQGAQRVHKLTFDPKSVFGENCPSVKRPLFFPIVSAATLASLLVKKCEGKVDGLIIEDPTAGGHNAPPRGPLKLDEKGEPIYGKRDAINIDAIKALGVPFWLAGSYSSPEKLQEALAVGAQGVQLGSLFAFSNESGLRADLKREAIQKCLDGDEIIHRDPVASPTGFPFQVLSVEGSLSEEAVYDERCRQCDLGYLREAYECSDGHIGWRCKAGDPETYVSKGGAIEDTVGRKCLCNSLMANIGLAQLRGDYGEELPLLTCGSDLSSVTKLASEETGGYSSVEVIDYLLASA